MQRSMLLGLCLCFFHVLSAQDFRFGLSFNAAKSKVQSNFSFPDNYRIFFKPSAKIGATVEKKLTKKSALGMELLWVLMEGQEFRYRPSGFSYSSWGGLESSGPSQLIIESDHTKIHSHYIGVPAYYRYSFGRFSIKGGLQALILLSLNLEKSHGKHGLTSAEEEPFFHFENADQIPLRKYDLGPQLGLDFTLNRHLRLRFDYYHGLINLYTAEAEWQRKNRQFSFGMDYCFTWDTY